MRAIGHLPNESQAKTFGDYLLTQGVRNEVEPDADGSWIIWVLDDEQLEPGRELLERFRQNPKAPEFSGKAADAERLRAAEEKEQADWRRRVHNRQRVFPGSQRFGAGPLTYALIVACVVVEIFSKFGRDTEFLSNFFISYQTGGFLPEVMHGQVWRLVTPILIHFGPWHLLFNMMWLFHLGSMIEGLQGQGRFVSLVVVLAVVSNVAQYFFSGPAFGGMSGVNYGLVGYVWIRGKCDPASGLFLDRQNTFLAIGWFFLCLVGIIPHVANYAHAAGLVLGMLWGWISGMIAQRRI